MQSIKKNKKTIGQRTVSYAVDVVLVLRKYICLNHSNIHSSTTCRPISIKTDFQSEKKRFAQKKYDRLSESRQTMCCKTTNSNLRNLSKDGI